MASLYPRKDSKYWWVEFVDADGERRQKSTKMRRDLPGETKKAREIADELTKKEAAASQSAGIRNEQWQAWVPRFIEQHYSGAEHELSRKRAEAAWRNARAFLKEREIIVPRQLGRQDVRDYIEWRKVARADLGVRKGVKNTALTEISFLSAIMEEAKASGFADTNPCADLGISRDEPKKLKARITAAEHRTVTKALRKEPEWMLIAYTIAWEQGCRLMETHLRLPNDVDLAQNILRLRTKGKKKRVAEVPLSPKLKPLLRRLLATGRPFAYEMPKSPAKQFWKFFQNLGMGHLSFHSTRVTFITRCYERGIPEETVMRMCLHASETVHRIYPRLPAGSRHLQDAMRQLVRAKRAA